MDTVQNKTERRKKNDSHVTVRKPEDFTIKSALKVYTNGECSQKPLSAPEAMTRIRTSSTTLKMIKGRGYLGSSPISFPRQTPETAMRGNKKAWTASI